ncbi:glycoside hydrolase family 5 protein [Mycena leptocephala]|nr:glycoside hydrolase family 5 protein [Mycena leptocephala]
MDSSVSHANPRQNYFAYALPDADRYALLDGMKASGMRVLRTWVSGNSASQKGSGSIAVPDLESGEIGKYDDTILDKIDQLMVDAHDREIKLLIGMYDQNALKANDTYGKMFGAQQFYTDPGVLSTFRYNAFSNRIKYILTTHQNKLLGNQPWSALASHIFGLEAQNEPMIFLPDAFQEQNWPWICNASQMANKKILILSGGNDAQKSVQPLFLESSCAVDVISIHDYDSDFSKWMPQAISQAETAGKRLLVEEWGSKVGTDREANLATNIKALADLGVPWLYWQFITNPDQHQEDDFEIQVNGTDWKTIANAAMATANTGPFDFSDALAL